MRKHVMLIAGAAALLALPAFAGINPLDPGLPQGWTSTVYGGAAIGNATVGAAVATKLSVVDSYHSAFCVECHGRNPSDQIQDPSGTFATTAMLGSHYVNNGNAFGATHSGGGFEPSGPVTFRNGGQYEKQTLWGVAGQATKGLSKYGSQASWANVDIANGDVSNTSAGDIVCESCHNVLVNRGDQLLLGGYDNAGASVAINGDTETGDQICVACHSGGILGSETYAAFHPNGNLPRFNQTAGKRHHVLSGDVYLATRYNPDTNTATNDSTMWAPGFSTELGPVATPWVKSTDIVNGTTAFAFRNLVNATGQGTLATAATTGDISTGTAIMCVSCHRPHNAPTTAGAFILRQGAADAFAGNAPNTADGGVYRQFDSAVSGSPKIYSEYVQLCKGCHMGYGN